MGTTIAELQRAAIVGDHLVHNFVPPISRQFTPTALDAIDACNDGDNERRITLPNGVVRAAWEIVEDLHLDQMVWAWDDTEPF